MILQNKITSPDTDIDSQVLSWLAYFDIFEHPLTATELQSLCDDQGATEAFENRLQVLVSNNQCYQFEEFYSINKEVERYVLQRKEKQNEAVHYLDKLPFYAKLISHFPYVKALAISGSLSKNVIHEDGDIDYFVITKEGRLWICRTLLVLFKKVFLLNSKKYFCVNYFVDEKNLKIQDENVYTAVEISYLLPVYNTALIDEMKASNQWSKAYIPNFKNPIPFKEVSNKFRPLNFVEFLLNGKHGDYLDLWLMKRFYGHWKRKFKHFGNEKFELTMRSNRGISKHHPQNFQQRVLEKYKSNLQNLGLVK